MQNNVRHRENLHPNNATPNPVEQNARKFHHLANLAGIVEVKTMITAAKLAGDSTMVESLKDKNEITEAQCNILKGEKKRKLWQQTKELRVTILVTAFAALMQYAIHCNLGQMVPFSDLICFIKRMAAVNDQCQFTRLATGSR